MAEDKTPILRKWHVHTALNEAVKAMKKREEKECRKGWRSAIRQTIEEALEAMNEQRPIRIDMSGD